MAKTKARILDRVYPRDLHGIIQHLWDKKPFFRGWPNVKLPPKAVFDEIIDVCYHASMLTEEGRPTVFRIVFLDSQSPVSPRDHDELPPVTRYILREPVSFTQGELRRLAPVADPRRVLIAVEHSGRRLQIYGLVDIGMGLWEMARHERIMGQSSPEALVVMSTRPGELSISRGDRPVLRMRDGKIVTAAQSVLREGPFAEFFDAATGVFIRNACRALGHRSRSRRRRRSSFAHPSFIESVLLYTAEMKHGGTLLFVPDEITHDDPRLRQVVDQIRLAQHATAKRSGVGNGGEVEAQRLGRQAAKSANGESGRTGAVGHAKVGSAKLRRRGEGCRAVHRVADGCRWRGGSDRHAENHRLWGRGHGELFRRRQGSPCVRVGDHRNARGEVRGVRYAAPIGLPFRREHGAVSWVHYVSGRRREGGQASGSEAGDVAVLSDRLYHGVVVDIWNATQMLRPGFSLRCFSGTLAAALENLAVASLAMLHLGQRMQPARSMEQARATVRTARERAVRHVVDYVLPILSTMTLAPQCPATTGTL